MIICIAANILMGVLYLSRYEENTRLAPARALLGVLTRCHGDIHRPSSVPGERGLMQ